MKKLVLYITACLPLTTLSAKAVEKCQLQSIGKFPAKAVYVKYKITDQAAIARNKRNGQPLHIKGDELSELVINKAFKWERLFGRSWRTDDDKFNKYMDRFNNKVEGLMQRQLNGEEVYAQVEALYAKHVKYVPPQKEYDYDRIEIDTPIYSFQYEKVNKNGYGTYHGEDSVDVVHDVLASTFTGVDKIFGISNRSSKKSSHLGYPCTEERFNTTFADFTRAYKTVIYCTADINGQKVDLYTEFGGAGEKQIIKAVKIVPDYNIPKSLVCIPGYVDMSDD